MDNLTNDKGNLELLDTIANGDELGRTPDEAVLLDGAHRLLELNHVGLIVPRLDLHGDDGLKNARKISVCSWDRYLSQTHLGDGLGLVGFLGGVLSNTLSFDPLSLFILLFVGSEEIDLVVILSSCGSGCLLATDEGFTSGAGSGEIGMLSAVRSDVLVPPGYGGVSRSIGGSPNGLEDGDVCLRRGITVLILEQKFGKWGRWTDPST